MQNTVIVSATRTPLGRFEGGLARLTAPELGAVALREAIARAGIDGSSIDEVLMGEVLTAGVGQAPARQAAIRAGIPPHVPCTTINKVCGSSLKAVMMADQAIRAGDASVVVAGGMESMSNAPYLMPRARRGYRMGHQTVQDGMIHDGLWDPFADVHMGAFGDAWARAHDVSRAAQDAYARETYANAQAAQARGAFVREIVAIEGVTADEEPARFDASKMDALRPAFSKDGTVTPANASKINDGAAAVVVTSAETARHRGLPVLGRIRAHVTVAGEAGDFPAAPARAIATLAERAGMAPADIDLFEVSEAFAVVPIATMRALGIPRDRMNVNGGAISLGHPIGASGARLLVTLLHAMQERDARRGCATLCLGGGEAVALLVER